MKRTGPLLSKETKGIGGEEKGERGKEGKDGAKRKNMK